MPVRVVLGRDDRLFPAPWLRQVAIDRLGVVPDEIDCGRYLALARPRELTALRERYRLELVSPGSTGTLNRAAT